MSSIVIKGNTSGQIELAAPAVAGTNTITLPASTGTIVTDNTMPTGSVLQVVQTDKTDTASITSASTNTFVDLPGMSVVITPSSASSKILVLFTVSIGSSVGTVHINLVRDATNIAVGGSSGSRLSSTIAYRPAASPYTLETAPLSYTFLDSPNSTSAITYKLQGTLGSSYNSTYYVNRSASDSDFDFGSRVTSTITVMEVAG